MAGMNFQTRSRHCISTFPSVRLPAAVLRGRRAPFPGCGGVEVDCGWYCKWCCGCDVIRFSDIPRANRGLGTRCFLCRGIGWRWARRSKWFFFRFWPSIRLLLLQPVWGSACVRTSFFHCNLRLCTGFLFYMVQRIRRVYFIQYLAERVGFGWGFFAGFLFPFLFWYRIDEAGKRFLRLRPVSPPSPAVTILSHSSVFVLTGISLAFLRPYDRIFFRSYVQLLVLNCYLLH